jgi:hypothetical protein
LVGALLVIAIVSLFSPWGAIGMGAIAFGVVAFFALREMVRIGFPVLPAPLKRQLERRLGWQEGA